ncbi:MAG: YidC/Oxa1 family membrane protein insertase [Actinobacteria bacterium]|nr:YidC/Oxa1 family membrane protein insertase [Actinomycetota bacterium]
MNAILAPFINLFYIVLEFFYKYVNNYGVAIILLTLSVRVILLPLTISQTRNMIQMQRIQPKLKELQQKYKDDKEKLQKELMSFYKEHNVNPLAGCFPLLLQMPIFFALYRVLIDYEKLKEASFLWIGDLSKPDILFGWLPITLILMVVTTLVTSLQTMTDPKQRVLTFAMPLIFGFIGYRLPAGVLLYWTVTNIWSMLQQYVMTKFGLKLPKAEKTSQMEIESKAEPAKETGGTDKVTTTRKPRKRGKRRG